MKRVITASYRTCCFCDLPVLPQGEIIESGKTFRFKQAADRYCAENKLDPVCYHQSDKVMIAFMDHKCMHRDKQSVAIEWGIKY